MLADLGRIDIFFRTGLVRLAREKAGRRCWAASSRCSCARSGCGSASRWCPRIETWEGTQVIGRHAFILDTGETAALVMTTAGVYDRAARRFVEIDDMIPCRIEAIPRPPSEAEKIFMASHAGLRALANGGQVGSEP